MRKGEALGELSRMLIYRALIYRQAGARVTITKVGSSGQEGPVCDV